MKNPHLKHIRRASAGAIGSARFSTVPNARQQIAERSSRQRAPLSPELKEKTDGYIKATQIVSEAADIKSPKPKSHVRIPDFLKS